MCMIDYYWYEFEYVKVDKRWVAYLYTIKDDDRYRITGKELKAFIESQYEGSTFEEKRNAHFQEESNYFRKYVEELGLVLASDIVRLYEPNLYVEREIDYQTKFVK